MALAGTGHLRVLDHIDRASDGCWCIHFFCADPSALQEIAGITQGVVGPGDALSFNAKVFVEERLECLDGCDRLTRRDPWWEGHQKYFIRSI